MLVSYRIVRWTAVVEHYLSCKSDFETQCNYHTIRLQPFPAGLLDLSHLCKVSQEYFATLLCKKAVKHVLKGRAG